MTGESGPDPLRPAPPTASTNEDHTASRIGRVLRRAGRVVLTALLAVGATLSRWRRRWRPYQVLRIEVSGDLAEVAPGFRLRDLGRRAPAPDLLTVLSALRNAREDPELRAVVLDVYGISAGWASLQSVRRAIAAVRAAGKPVWAYLTQPGTREYYLASAATRVLLAPAAVFDVTGLASEVVFLKGALDKLGIEAQLARAGRFKSAAEPFTRHDMSPEHRAMAEGLLDDLYDQLVEDVAAARAMSADAVRAALDQGPLLAAEALRRGLVDELAYPDELRAAVESRFGTAPAIELGAYQRRRALVVRRSALGAPTVGLLTVSGAIGGEALPASTPTTTWRGFRRELDGLARDPRIGAILVRVDSPGGSGLASDLMWREIVEARRRKPVLVSMGDVAASGGYYLAAGADHVTAEPATLTGSIGVLAGKPVLRGLYDRLGITKELVVRGNAGRHSDYVPLDEENLGRLRGEAEAFYSEFVGKVASGRGLARAAVESVAEGRVWTGRQALARGLVDTLGGLEQALDEVKRRLGAPATSRVALVRRPRSTGLWRSAAARLVPREAFSDALALLSPALAGERVLATMPFLVRFLPDAAAAGIADELRAALAGAAVDDTSGWWAIRAAAAGLLQNARRLVEAPLLF